MEGLRCRICDGLMCELNTPRDGSERSFLCCPRRIELESDGSSLFIRCPLCSAKNIAVERTDLSGTQIIDVVRGEMD